jgi:beta-mannosidase
MDVVVANDASRPVWPLCPAYPFGAGVDPDTALPTGAPLAVSSPKDPAPPWEAHFYDFDLCKTMETCANCVDDSFYPASTYASEFGWVGAPSLETLAPYLNGPSDFTLTSPAMAHHGNTFITMDAVRNMVLFNFGPFAAPFVDVPSAPAFRRALHFSMLAQADCLRAEVEHYRRGRDGPENTHGAMFWMLNAIWPSTSWDSLEFGGRWKLLHYAARDFYNPVALDAHCVPSITQCSALGVHVGSERLLPLAVNVSLDVVRFADGAVTRGAAGWAASVSPGRGAFFGADENATAQVLERGGCASPTDCLLLVSALDPATGAPLRPAAVRSLTLWARARLPPAVVTVTPLGGGAFSVVADAVAPHTMLHAAEAGHFTENNLLLLPGAPQTTAWVPAPGGGAVPSGVYAVSVNGGTPGMVAAGVTVT